MIGFVCMHCGKEVPENQEMATKNRNHCPFCLYSKHVDIVVGDRKSECLGNMKPIGLTFKRTDSGEKGELMLIHECDKCSKISINRIAADDDVKKIQEVFEDTQNIEEETADVLKEQHVEVATEEDREEVETQLFGKK